MLRRLKQSLLRINPNEVTVARRGFHCRSGYSRQRLEQIGTAFLHGYRAGIDHGGLPEVVATIESQPQELHGFGYEGAAMSLAVLDNVLPTRQQRWRHLLDGSGASHEYMLHVGYGWAIARIPWLRLRLRRQLQFFDPVLKWLVVDGFGFHEGYFNWTKCERRARASSYSDYLGRAFDQGLGRSLWFVCGTDIEKLERTVAGFAIERVPDLWSGVGLAAAYAGDASADDLNGLVRASREYREHLAQGATFAAEARMLAGNLADHTERACELLCGMSAIDAALLTRATRDELRNQSDSAELPAYEQWRAMIRNRLQEQAVCRN